ncbi:3-deoxy-7-phosphoheptulonate synthase [Streptomyces sp. NPDC059398]|uniref:3-deoxy-7-phosphoheptulonate synthase n=1 Tax=Streptomyces sp. NPDC059398 TaxID=3346820 RepID=UPI0036B5FEF8
MVIVMSSDAAPEDVAAVLARVNDAGVRSYISRGRDHLLIAAVDDGAATAPAADVLRALPGVRAVTAHPTPYPLVSRDSLAERSVVEVGGVPIGAGTFTLIAGPCAVETEEQTRAAARMALTAGAALLRGGAYKPRTSPYDFRGLGEDGLRILADVRAETGLPVITEVMDPRDAETVARYADMLQIGTRSMQSFPLLEAAADTGKPVLLKRGMSATVEEWLLAAEYIAHRGNLGVVLCERGIRTYERATRNTLDLSAVPVAQQLSHLPVIVDPSHAGGRAGLVVPLVRAGVAVGADGAMVDVHPTPEAALCDGPQALGDTDLKELGETVREWAPLAGRLTLCAPPNPSLPLMS